MQATTYRPRGELLEAFNYWFSHDIRIEHLPDGTTRATLEDGTIGRGENALEAIRCVLRVQGVLRGTWVDLRPAFAAVVLCSLN